MGIKVYLQSYKKDRKDARTMKRYKLILASASPRRKELLKQIGAEFEIIPSEGEETITSTEPPQVVLDLSWQKANAVMDGLLQRIGLAGQVPGAFEDMEDGFLVLGADTVVSYDGQILGKPKDKEDAARMLRMLSGNVHSVFTGVTALRYEKGQDKDGGMRLFSFYEETKVSMYPISEGQIAAYIETGEPMDKAGAYAIQGRCAVYIERIQGDYNNVVGLPVARIYQELGKSGIEIF